MARISINFRNEFEIPMIEGRKTATSRTKKFGKPGDWFQKFNRSFRILDIKIKTLGEISKNHFQEEGFDSPEGFIKIWNELHPFKRFNPKDEVYFHIFEIIPQSWLPPNEFSKKMREEREKKDE